MAREQDALASRESLVKLRQLANGKLPACSSSANGPDLLLQHFSAVL